MYVCIHVLVCLHVHECVYTSVQLPHAYIMSEVAGVCVTKCAILYHRGSCSRVTCHRGLSFKEDHVPQRVINRRRLCATGAHMLQR